MTQIVYKLQNEQSMKNLINSLISPNPKNYAVISPSSINYPTVVSVKENEPAKFFELIEMTRGWIPASSVEKCKLQKI